MLDDGGEVLVRAGADELDRAAADDADQDGVDTLIIFFNLLSSKLTTKDSFSMAKSVI
jgi:hypothetical protein